MKDLKSILPFVSFPKREQLIEKIANGITRTLTCWVIFFLICLTNVDLAGQGWERIFPNNPNNPQGYSAGFGYEVFPHNGGYFLISSLDGANSFKQTHENGYQTGQIAGIPEFHQQIRTNDGHFVFGLRVFGGAPTEDVLLRKIDFSGNTIWQHYYGNAAVNETVTALIQDNNGDYVFAGGGEINPYMTKTDESGAILWKISFPLNPQFFHNFNILETTDNGYLVYISGSNQLHPVTHYYKLDANGTILWQSNGGVEDFIVQGAFEVSDGFIISGSILGDLSMVKVDPLGAHQWVKSNYGGLLPRDFIQTSDGGYAIVGARHGNNNNNTDIVLIKLDANADEEWQKSYGGGLSDIPHDFKQTSDDGFIIIGSANGGGEDSNEYLIKTDANGNAFRKLIEGYVSYDINTNCQVDTDEVGFTHSIVSAESSNGTFYAAVDVTGYYSLEVDTTTYILEPTLPNAYWNNDCQGPITVTITDSQDSTQVDFAIQSVEQCPLMEVSLHSNNIRLCEETTLQVAYANSGTILAEDATVDVLFDPNLTFVNATVPVISQNGNNYTFDIGDVDFLTSSHFWVTLQVPCDTNLLGYGLCSEAFIFPDSSCLEPNGDWSGASLELRAWCAGDDVKMSIKNVGAGNMINSSEYLVVEDDVIMSITPYAPIASGDSIIITRQANGSFQRIETEQVPFHPIENMPSAFVEGCGIDANGMVSLGFINQFPLDNISVYEDIICPIVVAAYDPNEKVAFPEGYQEEHFIEKNTTIDYVIHFQNIGTAAANKVVVRDDLSEHLDPASLRMTGSSHDYRFELLGSGQMVFTFDNIMLPDSSTNETASKGFIKFRINQQRDLPIGTQIFNKASIFFDFNTAIVTNTTMHTIGEAFITVNVEEVLVPDLNIKVYPNPFSTSTTIEVESADAQRLGTLRFHLFDAMGREMLNDSFDGGQYQLYPNHLTKGIYFYTISNEQGIVNTGKVIFENK